MASLLKTCEMHRESAVYFSKGSLLLSTAVPLVPDLPDCQGKHLQRLTAFQLHGPSPPAGSLPAAPTCCDGFTARLYGRTGVSLSLTADHRPAGCRPAVSESSSRSLPKGRSLRAFLRGCGFRPAVGRYWMLAYEAFKVLERLPERSPHS